MAGPSDADHGIRQGLFAADERFTARAHAGSGRTVPSLGTLSLRPDSLLAGPAKPVHRLVSLTTRA